MNVVKDMLCTNINEIVDMAKKLGHEDLSQFLAEKRQEKRKRILQEMEAEAVERAARRKAARSGTHQGIYGQLVPHGL